MQHSNNKNASTKNDPTQPNHPVPSDNSTHASSSPDHRNVAMANSHHDPASPNRKSNSTSPSPKSQTSNAWNSGTPNSNQPVQNPGYVLPRYANQEQTSSVQKPQQPPNPLQYHQPSSFPYSSHVVYVEPLNSQQRAMYTRGRTNEMSDDTIPPGWSGFEDTNIRKAFVRKVYLIILLQLIFTLGVIALFVFEPNVKNFVQRNPYTYYIALAVFFGTFIGLACSGNLRRKFPTNVILLCIFTAATSFMMGTLSSHFNAESVFMAVGICAGVCFLVTLFSFHTKFDFTNCGGILCILLIVLLFAGIFALIFKSKTMMIIYAALGAIIFIMYLAYDTQMLMGGKSVQISEEEYVFAAIMIYIDVIYIFMFLLTLIGLAEN